MTLSSPARVSVGVDVSRRILGNVTASQSIQQSQLCGWRIHIYSRTFVGRLARICICLVHRIQYPVKEGPRAIRILVPRAVVTVLTPLRGVAICVNDPRIPREAARETRGIRAWICWKRYWRLLTAPVLEFPFPWGGRGGWTRRQINPSRWKLG